MDDRQILEAARELIKGKQYEAAYNLLQTIPRNEIAIKWMGQLRLRDSSLGTPPATPAKSGNKTIRRIGWACGTCTAVFFIACCGLSLLTGFALQVIPAPYSTYETLGICPSRWWYVDNRNSLNDFFDAAVAANKTNTVALMENYIVEATEAKARFDSVRHPRCLSDATQSISEGMDYSIQGFQARIRGENSDSLLNQGANAFEDAKVSLEEKGLTISIYERRMNNRIWSS